MKAFAFLLALAVLSAAAYAFPSAGQEGIDTTYGSYHWEVCRADADSAWVTADSGGVYSPANVCRELGYAGVESWGGTCGYVCGYCDGDYSGTEYYDGAGGNSEELAWTVQWKCVDYQGCDAVPEFSAAGLAAVIIGAGIIALWRRD